jgi:aminoglycoside phosphotransferase (APT) family kinase protein
MPAEKMHRDEIDTDAALMGRLLANQFPQWADLPIEPVFPQGTDNALYRLGDDMVARLPRREVNIAGLEKERLWLPHVAPFLPVSVPEPLAEGVPGDGYPFIWSVYSWLDGRPATSENISDRTRFARDLSRFITALERVDSADGPQPGQHNAFRGVRLERRDRSARSAIAALAERINTDIVTAAWEEALAADEWRGAPVWIHGDLDSRNLLVDERGRLSGVIDFGCLGVGDSACDVMAAWKLFTGESRDVFREELAVDDATWDRSRGWALSQALIALPYYTMETNPVLVREAQRWMTEVLADYAKRHVN